MDDDEPSGKAVIEWIALIRSQRAALSNVTSDLRRADLPPLEWYDVLLELDRADEAGLRPRALEARLLLAQHNVSRLLDRLEAAGLIRKRPCGSDRRGQIISITAAGRELRRTMWPVYRAAIHRCIGERLNDVEAAQLATLLEKLFDPAPLAAKRRTS